MCVQSVKKPKTRKSCSAYVVLLMTNHSKYRYSFSEFTFINFSNLTRFYICCDKCQDWFHGTCVGILQSEAEFIDEYICPNCQKNNSINFANMKTLESNNFDDLLEFMHEIQVRKICFFERKMSKYIFSRPTRVLGLSSIQ